MTEFLARQTDHYRSRDVRLLVQSGLDLPGRYSHRHG